MRLRPIGYLLLTLTCFNVLPLFASVSSLVKETPADTVSSVTLIERSTTSMTQGLGFFGILKQNVKKLLPGKQDTGEQKGSPSATLKWFSFGFILLGLILFTSSQVAGGIALGLGALIGIVSLATKKRNEVQKRKARKAMVIVTLSVIAGLIIAVLLVFAAWSSHAH